MWNGHKALEEVREEKFAAGKSRKLGNMIDGPIKEVATIERHDAIESLYNRKDYLHNLF